MVGALTSSVTGCGGELTCNLFWDESDFFGASYTIEYRRDGVPQITVDKNKTVTYFDNSLRYTATFDTSGTAGKVTVPFFPEQDNAMTSWTCALKDDLDNEIIEGSAETPDYSSVTCSAGKLVYLTS